MLLNLIAINGWTENPDHWQHYLEKKVKYYSQNIPNLLMTPKLDYLKNNQVSALALPSGQIVITKGMIEKIYLESDLDFLIAHEIAHLTNHHDSANEEFANNLAAYAIAKPWASNSLDKVL